MNKDRFIELLAYAKECFANSTNPFETRHLVKKGVTADECRDLSNEIATIIDDYLFDAFPKEYQEATEKAKREEVC